MALHIAGQQKIPIDIGDIRKYPSLMSQKPKNPKKKFSSQFTSRRSELGATSGVLKPKQKQAWRSVREQNFPQHTDTEQASD